MSGVLPKHSESEDSPRRGLSLWANTLLGRLTIVLTIFFVLENALVVSLGAWWLHRDYAIQQQEVFSRSAQFVVGMLQRVVTGDSTFTDVERIAYEHYQLQPQVRQFLVDESGSVLHAFYGRNQEHAGRIDPAPLKQFVQGGPLPIFCQDPSRPERLVTFSAADFILGGERLYLLHIFPQQPLHFFSTASLRSLMQSGFVLGFVVLTLGASVLAVLLGYAITANLRNLQATASQIAAGELSTRAAIGGAEEVRDLAISFNQMAEQIEASIQKLQEEDRLRRELVGGLSHDISAPAGVIVNCADYLLQAPERQEPQQRQMYIESMTRNAQSIHLLTDDLLQLVKLGATDFRISLSTIEVDELLADAYTTTLPKAQAEGKTLECRALGSPTFIRGDIVLLMRVLTNLLGNALRYTAVGGEIVLAAEVDGYQVTFSVSDSGVGISPEDLPMIFEPYYQGGANKRGAVGLGLSICRRVVEAHGSRMEVASELGQGTVFKFSLPLLPEQSGELVLE